MEKQEAIKKLEETVGAYLLSGRADDTTCGEWREILETLRKDNTCTVAEYDRDHIWYKGRQYISLRRFLEVKKEQELKFIAKSDGTIEQIQTREHGEWILVSEGLPKLGQEVLCYCQAKIYDVLRYTKDGWFKDAEHCYMDSFVIAWMPLPEPYKEGPKMSTYIKEYSTIVEADEDFTSCDRCVHSEDSVEVCKARLCYHAIHELKDCYEERKQESGE